MAERSSGRLSNHELTRRQVLSHTAASGVLLPTVFSAWGQVASGADATVDSSGAPQVPGEISEPILDGVPVRWLERQGSSPRMGVTWGTAWPRGAVTQDTPFGVFDQYDQPVPSQSWVTANWPDGSVKWAAHAVPPQREVSELYSVRPGIEPTQPADVVEFQETRKELVVDNGEIRCVFAKSGESLIRAIERGGRAVLRSGRLVALHQNRADTPGEDVSSFVTACRSRIKTVAVENAGPVRAVVKVTGTHAAEDGGEVDWLPFAVRFYLYAGCDHVRMIHSFIYDGDEHRDFIRGLGVRFDVALNDELYDRHTRFVSAAGGLWAEAVRGVTGMRRDPGERVRRLQVEGKKLPPTSEWDPRVADRLSLIPSWGDVTLSQLSSDGFQIDKRTAPGHAWVKSDSGTRAAGVGYVGGADGGGVAFGQRDFWQRYPAQLDVRGAANEQAEVTLWMWSPRAGAMDLRFYHDGLGMDTFEQQLEGLNITYEDYEPGFGTPHGIARTTELNLWITDTTPENQKLVDFAADVINPPLLAASPQSLYRAEVFGPIWGLPDRSTPAKQKIEQNLDFVFASYQTQREQRRWYGFWDYGDVMHTYDPDRHQWRYDVGGYAWDNSELSPDLWLWYFFLRTGRADVFRFAEAMCRHTGEVDVYHLGRFEGLGTRHNVQHWGCSAKQLRISTAAYRRFFYFLTADERTGDLLEEQIDGEKTFLNLDPLRKVRTDVYKPDPRALSIGMGTDWSALAMAWFTHYERTGDPASRDKLLNSMRTIGKMALGWFTKEGALMDPQTGRYVQWDEGPEGEVSHLAAVFGLVEICVELVQNFDEPEFTESWLMYCRWYNADRRARKEALGLDFRTGILTNGHSRLTAYAAKHDDDAELAQRAWKEFFSDDSRKAKDRWTFKRTTVSGVDSLNPVEETPWLNTNDASQWGLAAIQNLALIGKALPSRDARTRGHGE